MGEDQIAVRFGKWKFMNFNVEVNTFKCDEHANKPGADRIGDPKKVTVSRGLQDFLNVQASYWERTFDESITVADSYKKKKLKDGFSLYNLENDPFELDNLLDPSSGDSAAYDEIIEEIMKYIDEEKNKGHVLPPIPGDENGKLYTRVFQRMGPVYGGAAKAYYETKRIIPLDIGGYYKKKGFVGNDWCTGDFYEKEESKFLEIINLHRGDPTKYEMVKDTNLLLSKSIFFN